MGPGDKPQDDWDAFITGVILGLVPRIHGCKVRSDS